MFRCLEVIHQLDGIDPWLRHVPVVRYAEIYPYVMMWLIELFPTLVVLLYLVPLVVDGLLAAQKYILAVRRQ